MTPYITLFLPFAFLSVLAPRRRALPFLWVLAFLALLIFVGLRHHVGMDWNNYQHMIRKLTPLEFFEAVRVIDPLYGSLLWASGRLGHGVYGANLVVSLMFLGGLFRYARHTPSPWLALVVAIPMLVIVIGMSANRQAVAIGVLLWLIAGWDETSNLKKVIGILIAALFHASALIFLIFVFLGANLHPVARIVGAVLTLTIVALMPQTQSTIAYYDIAYGGGQNSSIVSSGALVHTLLNGAPALLVFANARLRQTLFFNQIHRHMALLSIVLVPASLVVSTPASRLSMYLFPISMLTFSTLPHHFNEASTRIFIRFLTAFLFLTVLIVWLGYSNNGFAYLPYQNVLTTEPFFRELCC